MIVLFVEVALSIFDVLTSCTVLQKAEADLERARKLCQTDCFTEIEAALRLLDETRMINPYSEPLLEFRAEILFKVGCRSIY